MKKISAVWTAVVFGAALLLPALSQAQVAPAPSKDTANPSDKPAKKAKKKTASSVSPAPSKDTANPSAKTAPKADEGTGANPSQKKTP